MTKYFGLEFRIMTILLIQEPFKNMKHISQYIISKGKVMNYGPTKLNHVHYDIFINEFNQENAYRNVTW